MRLGRGSFCAALDGRPDGVDVVAVVDALGVPLVGVESLEDVLAPGHARGAVELDVVVVPEVDELAEAQVPGQRRRLRRDALLEIAVGHDRVDAMIDDLVARPVELVGQPALGDRHPDAVREALAERAGGRLDARREAVLGVARRPRAPLAEALEVVERDVVAGQVEDASRAASTGVPGRQHEAVAVGPVGLARRVAQEAREDHVGRRRHAHRRARVARLRLLDAVDRQRPDRVDGQLVETFRRDRHRTSLRLWAPGNPTAGAARRGPATAALNPRDCSVGARSCPRAMSGR